MSDKIPVGISNLTDQTATITMSGRHHMQCEMDGKWYVISNSGTEKGHCTMCDITFEIEPGGAVKFKI